MTAQVTECAVVNCSFNDLTNGNALGITIGGASDHAQCATFINTGTHGGLLKVLVSVGARQCGE